MRLQIHGQSCTEKAAWSKYNMCASIRGKIRSNVWSYALFWCTSIPEPSPESCCLIICVVLVHLYSRTKSRELQTLWQGLQTSTRLATRAPQPGYDGACLIEGQDWHIPQPGYHGDYLRAGLAVPIPEFRYYVLTYTTTVDLKLGILHLVPFIITLNSPTGQTFVRSAVWSCPK